MVLYINMDSPRRSPRKISVFWKDVVIYKSRFSIFIYLKREMFLTSDISFCRVFNVVYLKRIIIILICVE